MVKINSSGLQIIRVLFVISFLVLAIISSQHPTMQFNAVQYQPLPKTDHQNLARFLDEQTILIEAGYFLMGSDTGRADEKPYHRVYLNPYIIDRYETTNIQYQRFLRETDLIPPRYWTLNNYPPGQQLFPVVGVKWEDAQAYCNWVGKRLPTEAEWEKACRGEFGRIFPWGNDNGFSKGNVGILPAGPQPEMWDQAWEMLLSSVKPAGNPGLTSVGSFPLGTTQTGVFDMIGNASEWTADRYNWDGYWNIEPLNPLVTDPPWNHVVRGSAWLMPYGTIANGLDLNRCSTRSSSHGDTNDARIGFRCVKSVLEGQGK